jgi:prolyl oligopeptidase
MKSPVFLMLFIVLSQFLNAQKNFKYNLKSTAIPTEEVYWGEKIIDNYFWLEDKNNKATTRWMDKQDKFTRVYLSKINSKYGVEDGIIKFRGDEEGLPMKTGKYIVGLLYTKRNASADLYYWKRAKGYGFPLVETRRIEGPGEKTIHSYRMSKDETYLAYQFSRNGSDWREIKVIRMKGPKRMDDHLRNVRFSSIVWNRDGFYYTKSSAKTQMSVVEKQAIYYHKVGQLQSQDKLIFKKKDTKGLYFDVNITSKEKYLFITESHPTRGYSYYYIDLEEGEGKTVRPVILKTDHEIKFIDTFKDNILISMKISGGTGFLATIDLKNPKRIEPLTKAFNDATLIDVKLLKSKIIAVYHSFQESLVVTYDYDGKQLFSLPMGVGNSLSNFYFNKKNGLLYFYIESYVMPPVLYSLNTNKYNIKRVGVTKTNYEEDDYLMKPVEFTSKDGTKVPMIIMYKKGMKKDGKNPTLLKTYGGFGSIETASFNPSILYFLDRGGVFAFPKVRGDGEKGLEWANAGKRHLKQNTFDDFISAAEYLIAEKYTSSEKLAITGGSNGGLVVGAALIQRPELFKVAVPVVGVFDMLHFESYTVGSIHTKEFGTVKNEDDYKALRAYSPYHNIKEGVNYPATMIMTSDNDERVPPMHSYKFAAALQNNKGQVNPILLRVERDAGHNGASNYADYIAERKAFFSFNFHHLDL